MPQFARPITDMSRGSWTASGGGTTNLWSMLDEVTADDADFVQSTVTAPTTDFYEVLLSQPPVPLIKRGHIIRVRARKNQPLGNTRGITVELRQGTTLIASYSNADLTALWSTLPYTLTPAEDAAITDYSNLRLRLIPTGSTGGSGASRRSVQVSFCQFRVPDSLFGAIEDTSIPGIIRETLDGMTDRALTVTKQADGSYRATRDGKTVDVRLGQTFGVAAIDDKRAQFDGLVALHGDQVETYAALVAWKVVAYAELVKGAGKATSDVLSRKLAYWQGEAKRLDGKALVR